MELAKWKRAVIHLEGATNSFSKKRAGMPDFSSRDIRSRGTALYYRENGKDYLITARHVLHNIDLARKEISEILGKSKQLLEELSEDWVFSIIFRVPSLDEVLTNSESPRSSMPFLMNLQAGVSQMRPYTLSREEHDLAVVSLNQSTTKNFAFTLNQAGYAPIGPEDIEDELPEEGEDIFAVGYPDSTSVVVNRALRPAEEVWASQGVSQPVCAFGKIGMRHQLLSYFWADVSIYPGNSGGPVISGGKLAGIISAQASVENVRIPFAKVSRASLLRDLLHTQQEKDKLRGA